MVNIDELASMFPGGFLIYEAWGEEKITYVNQQLLDIFSCATVEEFMELTGGSFRGVVYEDDLEEVQNSISEQIAKYADHTDHVVYRIKRKDGVIRWVDDYGRLISTSKGEELFGVFIKDITEKKLHENRQSIQEYMKWLKNVFDIVRLVDVSKATVCVWKENGEFEETEKRCFSVWNKEHRCENCISAKVLASKGQMSKYEFIGNEPYHVISKYIELEGRPYILEMVNRVEDKSLMEAYGKDKFADFIKSYNHKLYIDSLTGAYNRNYLEEQLSQLTGITAVAMMDLDYFKNINDSYGHDAGDEALKMFVNTVKSCIRAEDTVVRLGGDEFLVIFDNLPPENLYERLEMIRQKISETRCPEYPEMRITSSIGAVKAADCGSETRRRADHALYEAKKMRNCVKVE